MAPPVVEALDEEVVLEVAVLEEELVV